MDLHHWMEEDKTDRIIEILLEHDQLVSRKYKDLILSI